MTFCVLLLSLFTPFYGQIIFHRTDISHLHFHQQFMRIPVSPHPSSTFIVVFFITIILVGVKCYLMVLVCISLITNDDENLNVFIDFLYTFLGDMSMLVLLEMCEKWR